MAEQDLTHEWTEGADFHVEPDMGGFPTETEGAGEEEGEGTEEKVAGEGADEGSGDGAEGEGSEDADSHEEDAGGDELAAPKGLNKSERAWFDSLDEAGKKAVIRQYGAMERHLTKKAQELGEFAKYTDKPELVEALRYHSENPEALNVLRFVENDPQLGPAVANLINSFGKAKQAGEEWDPASVFKAPEAPANLKKYEDMSDDELRDAAIDDPGLIRGLITTIAQSEKRVEAMLKPIHEQKAQADQQAELNRQITAAMSTLPKELRNGEPGGNAVDEKTASELNEQFQKHGAEWLAAGKSPSECLSLAAEKVLANRKEAEAMKKGEAKGKEALRRRRQQGARSDGELSGSQGALSERLEKMMDEGFSLE